MPIVAVASLATAIAIGTGTLASVAGIVGANRALVVAAVVMLAAPHEGAAAEGVGDGASGGMDDDSGVLGVIIRRSGPHGRHSVLLSVAFAAEALFDALRERIKTPCACARPYI